MLVLKSDVREPTGLAFSPDARTLVAVGKNAVQVWPRWLDTPPQPVFETQVNLERFALSPDGAVLFQYLSADSRTRALTVTATHDSAFGLPKGPSWFHFTSDGGFFIVCHGRGKLSRFDYAPDEKKRIRKTWTIDRARKSQDDWPPILGSHYAFGGVCGAAGVFIAVEYRRNRDGYAEDDEDFGTGTVNDSLTVRSVNDGALVHRDAVTDEDGQHLVIRAGLTLTIHPSGTYFAYPEKKAVRFRSLATAAAPPTLRYSSKFACRAVAFHPSGALLAATGDDATVRLYDTTTWQLARSFDWEIGPPRAVCFSANGAHAAAIGAGSKRTGGKIVVWDVDT